jgi:hypothetical protein
MSTRQKGKSSLYQLSVRPIPSRYTTGAWASVRATIKWRFEHTRVTSLEERSAVAVAHRIAAEVLEATPPDESWCLPEVELVTSYSDIVEVAIAVELAHGSEDECRRARALLTEITNRLTN